MLLDITDDRMKARVSFLPNGMVRFTLDYPKEELYSRRVRAALARLLTPQDEEELKVLEQELSQLRRKLATDTVSEP